MPAESTGAATYVLVHGGWSGAHGFRHVRRALQSRGHDVFTPSLTGIGERAHLLSPQIDLTTHIQDVVNVVLYEDLDDVVLLGFSYGGAVVTGAVERPHPLRCFTEPVRLSVPLEEHNFGLTYIKATADGRDAPGGEAFWDAAAHAQTSDRWRYREIETTHMVASNRPEQLADILLGLA